MLLDSLGYAVAAGGQEVMADDLLPNRRKGSRRPVFSSSGAGGAATLRRYQWYRTADQNKVVTIKALIHFLNRGAVMKNPFMSAFLSAANRVAGSARAQATAAVKREAAKSAQQVTTAWTNALLAPLAPRRKKKRPAK